MTLTIKKWLKIICFTAVGALESIVSKDLEPQNTSVPRVLGVNIQKISARDPVAQHRLRRRSTQQATLDNLETYYFVNGTIGTPPQRFRFHVDTGSSDLWVNAAGSSFCTAPERPCDHAGTFVANASSTYRYVGSHFAVSYVDGSKASGDYVTDDVTLDMFAADGSEMCNDGDRDANSTNDIRCSSGIHVHDLQLGVGYASSAAQGILGIGYAANEAQVGRSRQAPYDNLPLRLVRDGRIARNAYSLWLNDLDASTGRLLFGGVDVARFDGRLATLPVQRSARGYVELLVTLTQVAVIVESRDENSSGTNSNAMVDLDHEGDDRKEDSVVVVVEMPVQNNAALAVLLDSGSSLSYLPDDWVHCIYSMVGARLDPSQDIAFVPCGLASTSGGVRFEFSGVSIFVPMDELVIPVGLEGNEFPGAGAGVVVPPGENEGEEGEHTGDKDIGDEETDNGGENDEMVAAAAVDAGQQQRKSHWSRQKRSNGSKHGRSRRRFSKRATISSSGSCLFGIAPSGDGTNVLGDTFLRSAYVVYDLENNEISLAQTIFNATGSLVLEIPATGPVPYATPVRNPVPAKSGLVAAKARPSAAGGTGLKGEGVRMMNEGSSGVGSGASRTLPLPNVAGSIAVAALTVLISLVLGIMVIT